MGLDCSEERRRLAALYETGLLFSNASSGFDRITSLASRMFGTKVSLISFASDDFISHKSRFGCELPALHRKSSFCDETIKSDIPFKINDAANHYKFSTHPRVMAGPRIRFYAGAPICLAPGLSIGSVGMLDPEPRHFTQDDAKAIDILAKMALTEIRLLATARALRDVLSS